MGRLACLLSVSLLFPAVAFAELREVWRTPQPIGRWSLLDIGDFDANGAKDFLTVESPGAGGAFFGVRLAATGALQAQTANAYAPLNRTITDLDGDGPQEILFLDDLTGREVCLAYTGPPGPIVPRWAIRPFSGHAPFTMFFANLDGNDHQFVVFRAESASGEYEIYTNTGALFAQYNPSPPPGWVPDYSLVQDFDGDGRDEILLVFRDQGGSLPGQFMILLESATVVGVESGQPGVGSLRAVELGASIPNPTASSARIEYRVPSRGPATLRLLDIAGREVRVLVNGEVEAGRHEAIWDGRDARGHTLPAGAYFYELTANGERSTRQIIRLK